MNMINYQNEITEWPLAGVALDFQSKNPQDNVTVRAAQAIIEFLMGLSVALRFKLLRWGAESPDGASFIDGSVVLHGQTAHLRSSLIETDGSPKPLNFMAFFETACTDEGAGGTNLGEVIDALYAAPNLDGVIGVLLKFIGNGPGSGNGKSPITPPELAFAIDAVRKAADDVMKDRVKTLLGQLVIPTRG